MIKLKHRWSFLVGAIFGGVSACTVVLYAAQLASPLWVLGEDIRRTFELEKEAKDAYRNGVVEKSLDNIRTVAMLRKMRPRPTSENQWPFTYPVLPLYLYIGGIDREQFAGITQSDNIQFIYECAEVYLLKKSGMEDTELDRRIKQLKLQYPQASKESCSAIAEAYFQ